jgi:predicted RNase H-like HicB family nuclease
MQMELKLWKEGKFIIISNEAYGITTQGRSLREALINFQDAFITCIHDRDWRQQHSISDSQYSEIMKKEETPQEEISSTIYISKMAERLVTNVKKTSQSIGVSIA